MSRDHFRLLCCALALASCNRDATGPGERQVELTVLAGDAQFGLAGALLEDPLQVMVIDANNGKPVEDVTVSWQVTVGSGVVSPTTATTDARGIAATTLRLGSQLGTYRVEASADRQVGATPGFAAEAVLRPEIQAITPGSAAAGQTVVITGTNFHSRAEYNAVRFAGIQGRVLTASTTRIEVVVPSCVPSRTVAVDVLVGSVASATWPLAATGTPGSPLALAPGEARVFADPAELACLRLPGGVASARYILIAQNAVTVYRADMPFELATFSGAIPAAAPPVPVTAGSSSAADQFELRLRLRERAWVGAAAELRAATRQLAGQVVAPEVGDQRTFKVLNADDETVSITAEIKAISERAILYQDLGAPTGGFTAEDFSRFGVLFDDPIYDTDVGVFGSPSDVDGNGRIIILFTPRVNALTKRGESSFIAGYFYGCDLVDRTQCGDTNRGEIFYSLVPDPQAKFGDTRLTSTVLRSVLPVLAHELQHMINFAQRDESLDALWLSEGLAHTAEDIVGDVFAERGEAITARDFRRTNYTRASRFLADIADVSMIAEDSPGTLELRGASWLFVRYLRAHYGNLALLGKLTRTTLLGTANVTTQTGQSWARLLSDFGVALYSGTLVAPTVMPLDARHTFGALPVRSAIIGESGAYPLVVRNLTFGDAAFAGDLPSAGTSLFAISAPGTSTYAPVNLVFAGARGGPFAPSGVPQLTIYRMR